MILHFDEDHVTDSTSDFGYPVTQQAMPTAEAVGVTLPLSNAIRSVHL